MDKYLNIHASIDESRANGPGVRFVIWVQGCTLGCKGCFNPQTHPAEPTQLISVTALYNKILECRPSIEGITVSGGEPFLQCEALRVLFKQLRSHTDLSILVFSGYTKRQIECHKQRVKLLDYIDVLISGPFVEGKKLPSGFISCANKEIHFLTTTYNMENINQVPDKEIIIDKEGNIFTTGIQL